MCTERRESGFSLIEVMVSLSIFSMVSAGMFPAFVTYMKFNSLAQVRTEAAAAAQQKLDELRTVDPATMPSSGTDPVETIQIGDHTFDVWTAYCVDATHCTGTSRHILVDIAYNGTDIYSVQTVYTQLK